MFSSPTLLPLRKPLVASLRGVRQGVPLRIRGDRALGVPTEVARFAGLDFVADLPRWDLTEGRLWLASITGIGESGGLDNGGSGRCGAASGLSSSLPSSPLPWLNVFRSMSNKFVASVPSVAPVAVVAQLGAQLGTGEAARKL